MLMMMILNRELLNNYLSGTIPSSIGSLVNLEYLYVNPMTLIQLSSNHQQPDITRYSHIRYLLLMMMMMMMMMILNRDIHVNQLNGTIPSSIGSLVNLQYLYVNPMTSTHIHSPIFIKSITQCSQVRYLLIMILNRRLYNNRLSGTIPSSIGSLVKLQELYVNPMTYTIIL